MEKIKDLIIRYPILKNCEADVEKAFTTLVDCFARDKRLYVCGNGGSAADALHIVGELAKSFVLKRTLDSVFTENIKNAELCANLQGALPAFALVENSALSTAYANDCDPDYVFAQQVYAYARERDCVFCISTSGNSRNILLACETAKARGATTIALTGMTGGKLKDMCDICICVPEIKEEMLMQLQ